MATFSYKPREQRHRRVRARIAGTAARPRLAVWRSLKHIAAQLIDDDARRTLCSASDKKLTAAARKGKKPVEVASAVGALLAQEAKAKNISTVVFDRGGYVYHGRVKALADGARAGGLKF